jgi:hypothetical protein
MNKEETLQQGYKIIAMIEKRFSEAAVNTEEGWSILQKR